MTSLSTRILRAHRHVSKVIHKKSGSASEPNDHVKLAVIIHLYYVDLWPSFRERLIKIDTPFDLFISVQEENRNIKIEKINQYHNETVVSSFPNRGRDVLPFLQIARNVQQRRQYRYFLKLHSKKSLHRKDGFVWLDTLLQELVPNDTSKIITTLENKKTGAIGPAGHVVSLSRYIGDNESTMGVVMSKMTTRKNIDSILTHKELYPFFGGTMFWGRFDLIDPVLRSNLAAKDFDTEKAQVDGTTAHALERLFGGALHEITKKIMYTVDTSGSVTPLQKRDYTEPYKHVG